MIDAVRPVETPEGIRLELRPAGPVPRALAWALDMAIRTVLYLTLGLGAAFLGRVGLGIFLVALFLIEWFYPVCFEVLLGGQTPGKMALGLRVLCEDGTPVGWSRAMVRSLLMAADFLPLLYGLGLAAMLLDRDARRLGDLAAGTLVVFTEPRTRPRSRERRDPALEAPASAAADFAWPLPLSLQEQRAVAAFGERFDTLSPGRAAELAGLLEPVTGAAGAEGLGRLRTMASRLRGSR